MAADHWVAKSMGSTPWGMKISDTVYACPWGMHEWLIMRTVVIGDTLIYSPANWTPTPTFVEQPSDGWICSWRVG